MRPLILAAATFLFGCSSSVAPDTPRVLGTIIGYSPDDPEIETTVSGRLLTVQVTTYGNGCYSSAGTEVSVRGLEATLTPYDYEPGCATRDLIRVRHTATVQFEEGGTARIRVRGLDVSDRSAEDMVGDTVTVERTVTLR